MAKEPSAPSEPGPSKEPGHRSDPVREKEPAKRSDPNSAKEPRKRSDPESEKEPSNRSDPNHTHERRERAVIREDRRIDEDLDLVRLTPEEVRHAAKMQKHQAKALLGLYVSAQKQRVRARLKQSAHDRMKDLPVDSDLSPRYQEIPILQRVEGNLYEVERDMGKMLVAYAKAQPLCRWAASVTGVEWLTAAQLFIEVDFHRCCCEPYRSWKGPKRDEIPKHACPGLVTAGHVWSYFGLKDPREIKWGRGEKRPYNVRMKSVCFQIGEQFKKNCPSAAVLTASEAEVAELVKKKFRDKKEPVPRGKELERLVKRKLALAAKKSAALDEPSRLYCRLYLERKRKYEEQNERGELRGNAERMLEGSAGKKVSADMVKAWEAGRVQPVGLDRMAMRYAVKIFLSHFHQIGRELEFGDKVTPWAIAHGGHAHYIPPPNWPMPAEKSPRRNGRASRATR